MADILKMLGELKAQRDQVGEAIMTLERLARGQGKRRGRPPGWMKEVKSTEPAPRKRKAFSAATRKQMSDSQKARWAAAKKTA